MSPPSMPWEEELRQIDDPVRLRRRAANLKRELAAAPARESTLAFLRGILEEVRFAPDSPLEGTGFELSVPREIGFVSRLCRSSADLSCGELRAPISEAGCSTTDRPPHPV
jgi:hypothetical protein